MPNKVVCVVSGGLDSTVMLYKIINEGYDPVVLTFHYGQKHNIEIEYAQRTCDKLGLEHHVMSIPALPGSALTDKDTEIPKEDYSVESQKLTVVPNRNMVFLSIAASHAIAYKAEKVFYAAHKSDTIYPDCSKEFVDALNIALMNGNYEMVMVEAPFLNMTKGEIVALGYELGVPFEDTWSCYDPVEVVAGHPMKGDVIDTSTNLIMHKHCGICGTCRERKQAFVEANVTDPTVYAQ